MVLTDFLLVKKPQKYKVNLYMGQKMMEIMRMKILIASRIVS